MSMILLRKLYSIFLIMLRWISFYRGMAVKRVYLGSEVERKNSKLCIFSSWDIDSLVDPYVFRYLERIQQAGFDCIFVSTSRHLTDGDRVKLSRICRKIIHRENRGYDFFSWKIGMQHIDLGQYESLLLANDSVYGPFGDLAAMIKTMDKDPCFFWGMSDSYETGVHHLQSYFIYFSVGMLASDAFKDFWRGVRIISDKLLLVREYELGLSTKMKTAGFALRAIAPYRKLEMHLKTHTNEQKKILASKQVNATLIFWDDLLISSQYPFIKTSVLRGRDAHVLIECDWQGLISDSYGEEKKLALANLRRLEDEPTLKE